MKNVSKIVAAAGIAAACALPLSSAQAWWGGPWGGGPWSGWGDGLGDMWGDLNFSASGRGSGYGRGYGYGYPYYGGYPGYGGWGGPWGGGPWGGGYPGYGYAVPQQAPSGGEGK